MKTPQEKYERDPEYRRLVDVLENSVCSATFTPSEIREAAIYACIRYEIRRMPTTMQIPLEMENSLRYLNEFSNGKKRG